MSTNPGNTKDSLGMAEEKQAGGSGLRNVHGREEARKIKHTWPIFDFPSFPETGSKPGGSALWTQVTQCSVNIDLLQESEPEPEPEQRAQKRGTESPAGKNDNPTG